MKKSVALIVIYTHRYDKNISVVEDIYRDKFSNIFHIVPFYDGNKSNVIPVYEHAHRFHGYITQALNSFYNKDFQHYFVINDDLILNPVINEDNYQEHLCLGPDDCFLPEIITLHERKPGHKWKRVREAYEYNTKPFGCEFINELPTYDQAIEAFRKVGESIKPLNFDQIYYNERFSIGSLLKKGYAKKLLRQYKHKNTEFNLKYPLAGGYSDTFVVSGSSIKLFARYCGIFAASNLFHELAIITAMILTTPNIKFEKDLKLQGKAFWTDEEMEELAPYSNSMTKLLANFPSKYLYLHPIKLSKWKMEKNHMPEKK